MNFVFAIAAILSNLAFAHASSMIIRPNSTATQEMSLILIQSNSISISQYLNSVSLIQNTVADSIKLWVAIPEFDKNTPQVSNLDATISDIVNRMKVAGLSSNKVVLAGHFQGGIALQQYVQNLSQKKNSAEFDLSGIVLLGSFWSRDLMAKLDSIVSVPSLTVAGELDGVSRVTRYMEAFYHQVLHSTNTKHPVVILPGVSHSQFFSGQPTDYIQKHDLKPEVSDAVAYQSIADAVSEFLKNFLVDLPILKTSSFSDLLSNTKEFLAPLVSSFEYEGFYYFLPPCYVSNVPGCIQASPFMSDIAQQIVANPSQVSVHNQDQMENIDQIIPHDYLPEIKNSCQQGEPCVLQTTTVTQMNYEKLSSPDLGDVAVSAQNMAAKMNSRQKIFKAAGLDASDFNKLDGISLCKLINEASYKWAVAHAGADALQRYRNIGQELEFGEDKVTTTGIYPLWDIASLGFATNSANGKMTVTSPAIAYSTSIPLTGGYHDCKLLSPARAMEWIYVDGLRAHGSLAVKA